MMERAINDINWYEAEWWRIYHQKYWGQWPMAVARTITAHILRKVASDHHLSHHRRRQRLATLKYYLARWQRTFQDLGINVHDPQINSKVIRYVQAALKYEGFLQPGDHILALDPRVHPWTARDHDEDDEDDEDDDEPAT